MDYERRLGSTLSPSLAAWRPPQTLKEPLPLSFQTEPNPDQVCGALWGLMIGDALGAPVEGLKEGHIRQLLGSVGDYVDLLSVMPEKPWRWRRPGLHTDDGQQALLLIEALCTGGGPAPSPSLSSDSSLARSGSPGPLAQARIPDIRATRLARLYLALASPPGFRFDSPVGAHRGTGGNFRQVIERLRAAGAAAGESSSIWTCGQPSAGTGAAMRIGPLGVWHGVESEEEMVRLVIEVSLVTHGDPRGIAAAVALALGLRRLASRPVGARLDVHDFMTDLITTVRSAEERIIRDYGRWLDPVRDRTRDFDLSASLGVVVSLAQEGNDDLARRSIVRQAREFAPAQPVSQPNHGFAPVALPMVFYRALSAPNFTRGLEGVVNDGGDADTMGAMTGVLLGGRFGLESIPAEWREGLVARRIVEQRAEALVLGYRSRPWDDLIAAEAEWTRDEDAARQAQVEAFEREQERKGKREAARESKPTAARKPAGPPPPPSRPAVSEAVRNLPFAPPPDIWLRGKPPATPGYPMPERPPTPPSAEEKKRDKTARGRKRIAWKEDRRKKRKEDF